MAKKIKKSLFARIKSSSLSKGLVSTFLGSLLSIALTFGVNSCRESIQEQNDRHLAALMVLGNIESFARNLETWQKENSHIDTACAIIMSIPEEKISALSDDSLDYYIDLIVNTTPTSVSHDETAEKIFSNNIETWKSVGNAMFIQKVGQLFSAIKMTKQQLDSFGMTISQHYQETMNNNQGSVRDAHISFLKGTGLREYMYNAHYAYVGYPNYMKDYLRYWNKICMDLIGVTEEEIDQHLSGMADLAEDEIHEPKVDDYATSPLPQVK